MMPTQLYQMTPEEVLQSLEGSRAGLPPSEAARRLEHYGPNLLDEREGRGPWPIVSKQFTDIMILILLAAAGIAGFMGDLADMTMILVIVVLNATLGFTQEFRAERALASLKRLERRNARVRRGGASFQIPASDLVPGDILVLEAGERVPSDGRLVEAVSLRVDEAHLTGESIPVSKTVGALPQNDLPVGDRINLVFMGTTVMTGRGLAVITETGMRTEIGKIAHLLREAEIRATPLQGRMAYLGRRLAAAVIAMTAVIFVAGRLRGEPLDQMLLTSVSIAVAAIPEGLPAMVTIALALGGQRMVKRNALVRKLPAVETLGSVTAICSDKTGTLTQNVMSVKLVYVEGRLLTVEGEGYIPEGEFHEGEKTIGKDDPSLLRLLRAAALCTNGHLNQTEGQWTVLGDPTEGAILAAAAKADLWKDVLETRYPRIGEILFDSERKRMTTVHRDEKGDLWGFTKGGIEEVLSRSTAVANGDQVSSLTREDRENLTRIHQDLAEDGVRLLAIASRKLTGQESPEDFTRVEEGLTFLGLLGMMDPPRPEAKAAVARCREAGIRPIMITGDHRATAEAIAAGLGIRQPGDRILTGWELDPMTPEELASHVATVSVYARVSPEHKVKIVKALQRHGEIVAMTGDGVNDAPALRTADIGVAMGRGGTDVAREASDMILLDDNFATIVSAVEEGRMIYDNIRKFTRYMLVHNSGEILTMFLAILFALPLPLVPLQILWMNLVTDGLPALALGIEPAERKIMQRPPRSPKESLFSQGLGLQILWVGLLMGLVTIALFAWGIGKNDLAHGRTMVFFALTAFQMFNVLAMRSERDFLWRIGFFSNPKLVWAIFITLFLQLAVTYTPYLNPIFHTTPLTIGELAACLFSASTVFFAVEGEKWFRFHRRAVQTI